MVIIIFLLVWLFFCASMFLWPAFPAGRQRLRPFVSAPDAAAPGAADDGDGAREPRRPKTPYWPPQAAAALPEGDEQQQFINAIAESDASR